MAGQERTTAKCPMTEGSAGPGQVVREGFLEEVPFKPSPTQTVPLRPSSELPHPHWYMGKGLGAQPLRRAREGCHFPGEESAPAAGLGPALPVVFVQSQLHACRSGLLASTGSDPSALEGQCLDGPQEPGQTGRLSPDLPLPDPMQGAAGTRQDVSWQSPQLCPRSGRGEARTHSPETAGVGLAQDAVVRGRQGVKPEVGQALGEGRSLKPIVAGVGGKHLS